MAEKLFAIKDAMNVKVTPSTTPETPLMVIDYSNSCSLSKESETTYAKKKGANAIAFNNAPNGTFTINSETATMQWLGLALGGTVTGDKIKVTDVAPATTYIIEGDFRCTNDDGTETIRTIKLPNTKPQPNSELTFDAEAVTAFSLVFDVMVDKAGTFLEMDVPGATGSNPAKSK